MDRSFSLGSRPFLAALAVILLLGYGLSRPVVNNPRDHRNADAGRCARNLRSLTNSLSLYVERHGVFPPDIRDASGRPLLSWRVALLPHTDSERLYLEFKLDEPWDSPHNKPLLAEMPLELRDPKFNDPDRTTTHYQGFEGPHAAFEPGRTLSWEDFPDGLGRTLFVVETEAGVPWTKPGGIPFDPDAPASLLGAGSKHEIDPGWLRRGRVGFNVAFACVGGPCVRWMDSSIDPAAFRAMITRDGGEPDGSPDRTGPR